MPRLLRKFENSLRHEGLSATIARVARYLFFGHLFFPLLRLRTKKQWSGVLKLVSTEDRFHAIYQQNLWGSVESLSGSGSTLRYTENLPAESCPSS